MESRHNPIVDIAAASGKHQVPRHRSEKRRKHIRDRKEAAHEAFERDVASAEQPRVKKPHDRTEHRHPKRDDDRIPHSADIVFVADDACKQTQVESVFVKKRVVDDHKDRNDDNDKQNHKAERRHDTVEIQGKTFAVELCQIGIAVFKHHTASAARAVFSRA